MRRTTGAAWTRDDPPVREVVELVMRAHDVTAAISALMARGLDEEAANDAVTLVSLGVDRARLYATGTRPSHSSGELESDPLFLAAVEWEAHRVGLPRRRWRRPALVRVPPILRAVLTITLFAACIFILRAFGIPLW